MGNWNGNKGEKGSSISDTATRFSLKPGDYSLGSMESRAAARSIIEIKQKRAKMIRAAFMGADGKEASHKIIKPESS